MPSLPTQAPLGLDVKNEPAVWLRVDLIGVPASVWHALEPQRTTWETPYLTDSQRKFLPPSSSLDQGWAKPNTAAKIAFTESGAVPQHREMGVVAGNSQALQNVEWLQRAPGQGIASQRFVEESRASQFGSVAWRT
jgi:hypothetical protein